MKKNIYVFSSGELRREENTLCFSSEKGKKFVPVSDVSSMFVFGEVSFNKRLLEFLSSNEITLHLYNYYGYYVGSFYPRTHHNSGFMTLKQCENYLDNLKRMRLARRFVEGALKNMLRNLRYYESRKGELNGFLSSLENCLKRLDYAQSVEELMAIEGSAREEYYLSFNKIIEDQDYLYTRRDRRPPKSRLDTLLSFGNSLLYVTILGEIYKTHLDPRIGFLHASNYRRFSLNLDVAEVFKPIVVDRVIFTLANKNMLDDSCFMKQLDGIYLSERGRNTFVQQYDQKLRQIVGFKEGGRASYQRLVRLELYKLEKHLMGEQDYQPLVAPW